MTTVTLSASDRGATVELDVGDVLTVTLPEDSGGGYLWTVDAMPDEAVALEKSEPGPQPAAGIGGAGSRELTFRAVRAGRAEIHLVHRRSWEDPRAGSDRFGATVVVSEPSA